jgi:arabinosyltransferase
MAKLVAKGSQNGKQVMLTMLSYNQIDFFRNWLASVREAGIRHLLVGAMDSESALELEKERVPCFMHQAPENIETLGLAWGEEGWRIMTWQQVFVVKDLVNWGLDVAVTDIDVAWVRDSWPLVDRHPEADILFSHDGLNSRNRHPKDEDLELEGSAHYNLNTGIYIIRSNNATCAFMSAWASSFKNSNQHDQAAMYSLLRNETDQPSNVRIHNDPGLKPAWNNKLLIGVVPVCLFGNGHSYTVSRLHEQWNTSLLAVHATWTMSGKDGKISRLREAMLWHDSTEYYNNGNFVTVDLEVPDMPDNFNDIQENEPMIKFHLDALEMQLEQLTVGLAIAVATGRIFIMPKLLCFCETGWYPGVRCRLAESEISSCLPSRLLLSNRSV